MCLGIPVQVKNLDGNFAQAEWDGVSFRVNTMLVEDIQEGDYVMIHAGCAIQKLTKEDAAERMELIREIYGEEETGDRRQETGDRRHQ